jgi:pseudouridine synthase
MNEIKERIQKYLSRCGVCSRREGEGLVLAGRVSVNGTIVTEPGFKVGADDIVTLDGGIVREIAEHVYLAYYKPRGVVTTLKDQSGRPDLSSLLGKLGRRVFPVGRLDLDSEGLLILTDDGDLFNRLVHPRSHVEKEYLVTVTPNLNSDELRRFADGVPIMDSTYVTRECSIMPLSQPSPSGMTRYRVVLREGKKRQIREMFHYFGSKVVVLKRVRIGSLTLNELKPGEYRYLNPGEIEKLLQGTVYVPKTDF